MTPILAQRLGTDRSFERLYRKYAGDVYRYALVVLRNEADAEDVTQTTFLNAYRAFEQGERPRTPQNWLIAIAHNVCRQRFRQAQRRPNEVAFDEDLAESVVDEDRISAEDIRRALGHLAFNQRAALVMRELEGRSYQEIAEILEVSVSAVETLIFRARRALREQLEESITCGEAELAISRQLDGRLPRKERGPLRAHLRECEECGRFARSQRAHRGALKSLAAIPLPQSLAGLFGGGGGAAVGTGVAVKAAAIGATAMVATGVGYEGVKHGIWQPPGLSRVAPAAHAKKAPKPKPVLGGARVFPVVPVALEVRHDQKPYRKTAVEARRSNAKRAVEAWLKPRHREVSPLPPSRSKIEKPTKTKPERAQTNRGQHRGTGSGTTHKSQVRPKHPPKKRVAPPRTPPSPPGRGTNKP